MSRLETINHVFVCLVNFDAKGKRDDLRDMRLRTKDTNRNPKALTQQSHSLQTLLIVRATTPNKYFDLMRNQLVLEFLESTDNPLEGSSNICEVGDTATNDENFAIGIWSASRYKINYERSSGFCAYNGKSVRTNGFGILIGLRLRRRPRVFTVVCQFVRKTMSGNGIGVNNTSAAPSNHCPDAAIWVQNSELERCTS